MAMMDDIKKLTNCTDEALLTILIDECKDTAFNYCNMSEYDSKLDYIVKSMVCEKYNRLYSEGLNSKNYSGISESYLDDFSPAIYTALKKHRKWRFITHV